MIRVCRGDSGDAAAGDLGEQRAESGSSHGQISSEIFREHDGRAVPEDAPVLIASRHRRKGGPVNQADVRVPLQNSTQGL